MQTSSASRLILQKVHLMVGLLILLTAFSLVSTQSASAHASLLSSTPADGEQLQAAPTEVVLEFSEPVGLVEGGTTLHREASEPLVLSPRVSDNEVTIPLEPLAEGAYVVQWRVISADSHPVSGTVTFNIGDADAGAVSIEGGVSEWVDWARFAAVGIKYFGLLSAAGILMAGFVVVRQDHLLVRKLSNVFASLGLVGIILELPFAALIQQGAATSSIPQLWSDVQKLQSNTLIAAAMSGIFVMLAMITNWIPGNEKQRWRITVGLMVGALLTLILSGHSRTREPVWLMMFSDAVHVIAAAIWLGGIIILAVGLRGRWRGSGFSNPESSAATVSRFSTLAGFTAAAVAVSGVVMGLVILESPQAFYRTEYGITLIVKIGLVAVIAALAAINRFSLIPRLTSELTPSLSRLRRLVTWEFVGLVAVIAVTGSLVHQDPNVAADVSEVAPQSAPATLYAGEAPLDANHTVRVSVRSDSGNHVTVVATIIDQDRNIVLPDTELQISWFLPEQDLGPIAQSLSIDSTTGAYHGTFSLPASGEWELGVQIRIDRFTDSRTTIDILVAD